MKRDQLAASRVKSASKETSRRLRPPRAMPVFNVVAKALLAAGTPLGPNGLITVRGRTSGLPRSTPVAIIEIKGRRWVWAPWGEVNWVRNLRAAGRATITVRRRSQQVLATELDGSQRVEFFRDIYGPLVRSIRFGVGLVRLMDGVDVNDPIAVAEDRRVFELHPADEIVSSA